MSNDQSGMPKYDDSAPPRPEVKLIGNDGNAYMILSLCREAARKAGWTQEEWEDVRDEMTAGDYDHLLGKVMEHFDVY